MTLEFTKVVDQVERMGRYLGGRAEALVDRLALAVEWLAACDDLEVVHERIYAVRHSAVSGYRGAAPAPRGHDEIINGVGAAPPPPAQAALIAADGSQVYPDTHGSALYYLTNLGIFTTYHGSARVPVQATVPELVYVDDLLQDDDGRLITNQTVNTRRTVAEVQVLARQAWAIGGQIEGGVEAPQPVFALHDGGLLKVFSPTEVAGASRLEQDYLSALVKLRDAGAYLAGYIDRSRSTNVISLLHLLSLAPGQITDAALRTNGPLEGVTDAALFGRWLEPGERSAIFTQNSPQNAETRNRLGDAFEIAFFYLNVGEHHPHIARVEIPMWVAADKRMVGALQALLIAQCSVQGRRRYPYALTRADELAFIRPAERQQLDELVRIALMRQQLQPERSAKLDSKGLARASKRRHRLGA